MGNSSSSETAIFALDPFVGLEALPDDDPLFEQMLSARIGAEHVSHSDEILEGLCSQLAANNPHTCNFQKLMRRAIKRLSDATAAPREVLTDEEAAIAANALFVTRIFLRYLMRVAPDMDAFRTAHLMRPSEATDDADGGLAGEAYRALVDAIIGIERRAGTLALLTEVCLLALTLLSAQMYAPLDAPPIPMLACSLCSPYRSAELAHALLAHHVRAPPPPPSARDVYVPRAAETPDAGSPGRAKGANDAGGAEGGGAEGGAGRAAAAHADGGGGWRILPAVLYLPRQLLALLFTTPGEPTQPPTLHSSSLCLLLVLAQDMPAALRPLVGFAARTRAAETLALVADDASISALAAAPGGAADIEGAGGAPGPPACAIDYQSLYDVLCAQLPSEPSVLLLYHLLHTNRPFLRYVLTRTDADLLLMPLLRGVYGTATAKAPPPARMYMLLIVLLILSQDGAFVGAAFAMQLPRVPWFRERILGQISVGSLAVCVLCRLVHANLNSSARRDPYVSTNCLAALANMAGSYRALHPYAALSLINLYARLAKRQAKLGARAEELLEEQRAAVAAGDVVISAGETAVELTQLNAEQSACTDAMRISLEIINAALSGPSLALNAHLVYSLLERQQLFTEPSAAHALLGDALANVQAVLAHFDARVSAHGGAGGARPTGEATLPTTVADAQAATDSATAVLTVEKVMAAIDEAAREWRPSALRQLDELRFTYEQEDDAEEFFTPYLWALVTDVTNLVDSGVEDAREAPLLAGPAQPHPLAEGEDDVHVDVSVA